jgi:hypothetical protein
MAKFVDYSLEDGIANQIDKDIFEAIDLGIDPHELKKLVEESISWAVKELDKEHFEA